MIARINAAYVRLVARITPRCREVTRLLSQGMDQPLPWQVRLRLRLHFAVCVWCRRYAEQLQQIRLFSRMFADKEGEHGAAILPAGSRERLEAALDKQMDLRHASGDTDAVV